MGKPMLKRCNGATSIVSKELIGETGFAYCMHSFSRHASSTIAFADANLPQEYGVLRYGFAFAARNRVHATVLAVAGIPDLHRLVSTTSTDNSLAIRTEGHAIDRASMSLERV